MIVFFPCFVEAIELVHFKEKTEFIDRHLMLFECGLEYIGDLKNTKIVKALKFGEFGGKSFTQTKTSNFSGKLKGAMIQSPNGKIF